MAKCCVVFSKSPFEDLTAFRVRHVLLLVSILTRSGAAADRRTPLKPGAQLDLASPYAVPRTRRTESPTSLNYAKLCVELNYTGTGKWKYVNPCLDFLGIPDQRTAYVKRQARPRWTYVRRSSVTPTCLRVTRRDGVYSSEEQIKHQSSTSLVFVRGITLTNGQ